MERGIDTPAALVHDAHAAVAELADEFEIVEALGR
jgi:hypothetical protein